MAPSKGLPRLVLLSTFNGEDFLDELVRSVLPQLTYPDMLIIRDDGSSDCTLNVLNRFAMLYPELVCVVNDGNSNVGPCQSFSRLLTYAITHCERNCFEDAYIFFCDQDDVWLPSKIDCFSSTLSSFGESNRQFPILVHSDLIVVDEKLNTICHSLWTYQKIFPQRNRLREIVLVNTVTGCACAINLAMAKLASPIPSAAVMHDWWCAIVASELGRIVSISEPSVLYRQHANNSSGANPVGKFGFFSRLNSVLLLIRLDYFRGVGVQASEFLNRFGPVVGDDSFFYLKKMSSYFRAGATSCAFWMLFIRGKRK